MPHIVYDGPGKSFILRVQKSSSVMFDKGIPSWIPSGLYKHIPRGKFKKLDAKTIERFLENEGRPILVELPRITNDSFDDPSKHTEFKIFAAVTFINALRAIYPCNKIVVSCNDIFFPIIPDFVEKVNGVSSSPGKWYREYSFKNLKLDQYFAPVCMKTQCIETLFFKKAGLAEPGKQEFKPVTRESPNKKFGNRIVVIHNGASDEGTWFDLSEEIRESGLGPFEIVHIDGVYDTKESAKETFDAITSASIVVCCGDSKLFPLSLHYGIPTIVFLPEYFSQIYLAQYTSFYSDLFLPYSIDPDRDVKKVVSKISKKIQKLLSPNSSTIIDREPDDMEPVEPKQENWRTAESAPPGVIERAIQWKDTIMQSLTKGTDDEKTYDTSEDNTESNEGTEDR